MSAAAAVGLVLLAALVILGPGMLLGPLLLRRSATEPERAVITPLAEVDYPAELQPRRGELSTELAALGFEPTGLAEGRNLPGQPIYAGFRRGDGSARATLIYTRRAPPQPGSFTLSFESDLASGERLITKNAPTPRLLPDGPTQRVLHLPGARAPGALWSRHQKRMAAHGPLAPRDPRPLVEELTAARDQLIATYLGLGLYEPGPTPNSPLRLTPRGARRIAWSSTPPLKHFLALAQWVSGR